MASFEKRKNGTWRFSTYRIDPVTQERKRFRVGGFKRKADAIEAEKLFNPFEEEIEIKNKNNNVLFQDYVQEFFREELKRVKKSTNINNQLRFNKNILPFFKDVKVKSIDVPLVLRFQNSLLKYNLSNRYINYILIQLSNYLDYLIKINILDVNVVNKISKLKNNDDMIVNVVKNNKVVEVDNFNKFISTFTDDEVIPKVAFEIMYKAGTRRAETRALTWNDIDFKNHTIQINKQLVNIGNGSVLTTTKSKTSNRIINMPFSLEQSLLDLYLKEKRKYNYDSTNFENLFVLGGVNAIGSTTLNRYRVKHIKLAGIPYFINHDLRHSYGSNMIANGFDIKYVSTQMGHESLEITLSVYHHLLNKTEIENKNNYYNKY